MKTFNSLNHRIFMKPMTNSVFMAGSSVVSLMISGLILLVLSLIYAVLAVILGLLAAGIALFMVVYSVLVGIAELVLPFVIGYNIQSKLKNIAPQLSVFGYLAAFFGYLAAFISLPVSFFFVAAAIALITAVVLFVIGLIFSLISIIVSLLVVTLAFVATLVFSLGIIAFVLKLLLDISINVLSLFLPYQKIAQLLSNLGVDNNIPFPDFNTYLKGNSKNLLMSIPVGIFVYLIGGSWLIGLPIVYHVFLGIMLIDFLRVGANSVSIGLLAMLVLAIYSPVGLGVAASNLTPLILVFILHNLYADSLFITTFNNLLIDREDVFKSITANKYRQKDSTNVILYCISGLVILVFIVHLILINMVGVGVFAVMPKLGMLCVVTLAAFFIEQEFKVIPSKESFLLRFKYFAKNFVLPLIITGIVLSYAVIDVILYFYANKYSLIQCLSVLKPSILAIVVTVVGCLLLGWVYYARERIGDFVTICSFDDIKINIYNVLQSKPFLSKDKEQIKKHLLFFSNLCSNSDISLNSNDLCSNSGISLEGLRIAQSSRDVNSALSKIAQDALRISEGAKNSNYSMLDL